MKDSKAKVILLFFCGGVIVGILLGCIVTAQAWKGLWFATSGFWLIPTRRYLLLSGVTLFLGLVTSYLVSRQLRWVARFKSFIRQALAALLVIFAFLIAALIAQAIKPSLGLLSVGLIPVATGFTIAVAMWVLTTEWHGFLSVLMILAYVSSIALANGVFLIIDASDTAFEITKLVFLYSFISSICGYWLVRTQAAHLVDF